MNVPNNNAYVPNLGYKGRYVHQVTRVRLPEDNSKVRNGPDISRNPLTNNTQIH